jgi:hypothetical protein
LIQQNKGNKLKSSKFKKFQSRGAREQFLQKTPLLINFWTVRPIFASNILIDSDWQGGKSQIFNKVPNFTLGEQHGILLVENTPKNKFLTNESIFTSK